MIAQFALRLICGMSLMWALMPRRQVTSGFFRIQMLVVMGLAVLAALMGGAEPIAHRLVASEIVQVVCWFIAFAGFVGSVAWTLERRLLGTSIGVQVLATSAGVLVLQSLNRTFPTQDIAWFFSLSELSAAGVLGGTVVGMLLGHWYLTSPTMSIDPLLRVNKFLGIASVVRLLISAVALLLLWNGAFDQSQGTSRWMMMPKMWLSLRWLAGVIGPLVVSVMVWRIMKYRNTQAATGVLFVGVILAFMGDMMAALLLSETMVPL